MIKVWPTSEAVLKHVKHPNGTRLRGMTEPADWPEDQFTFRRLADGDVTQEPPEPVATPQEPPKPPATPATDIAAEEPDKPAATPGTDLAAEAPRKPRSRAES